MTLENSTQLFSICSSITSKFCTIDILVFKSCHIKKIQIELVGMPIIFYCAKLHISNFNSSLVISIKQNMILTFNHLSH
jgi:hypothetical protein